MCESLASQGCVDMLFMLMVLLVVHRLYIESVEQTICVRCYWLYDTIRYKQSRVDIF